MQSDIWKLNDLELKNIGHFFPNGIIAIDLETTGLSPLVDKIIEIAAFKVLPSGITKFETLINPGITIPPETILFHNITDEMIANSPRIEDIIPSLKEFLGDLPIVAHNAKFDLGFIVMALQKNSIELTNSDIFCSCKLARQMMPKSKNHKLKTLVDELQIPLVNHHRALDDAYACLKVFAKCLEDLKDTQLRPNSYLFNLNDFNKIKKEEIAEHLKPLIQLVQKAAVIEIKYNGGKLKNKFRPVKLTGLINSPEGSVLYALCLLSNVYKTFQLKKIVEINSPTAEQIQNWLKA